MILFVSGEYPPDVGGVGDYTERLRAALGNASCPSDVLSRREVGRWDARSLVRLVRRAPPEGIVHIQYQPAAFDLLGDVCLMPVVLRRIRPRVRVVATLHDVRVPYLFPKAGRLRWQAVQLLAHSSHAVVAADERDLDALRPHKRYVIPIGSNVACAPPAGYDRAAFRQSLGISDLTLAYFGLLNASKGLDSLLQAFEIVLAARPHARLLLLGGSAGASDRTDIHTATALRAELQRFGASVLRPGFLAPPELAAYLLAADVALLPYVDGASPRRGSLLACAAHGLPIVSTLPVSSAVADAVLAVARDDATGMADAVVRVAGDAELRARLQSGGRELTQRTSWPNIAAAHVALYNELAN
ncbi:MAG: glycosyltransferase [Chloroflexi bacterium]|nr:glycosyltransferase [Chloroflexota bacterium]